RAAEESDFRFIGVAGASAGAIVAALLAAGYRAHDLMSTASPTSNLLTRYGRTPISLFGEQAWNDLRCMQRQGASLAKIAAIVGLPAAAVRYPRALRLVRRAWRDYGHFETEPVRAFVNDMVHRKLQEQVARAGKDPQTVPKRVRFADMDDSEVPGVLPLKVVATDVDAGALVLFDRERTPEAEVGEAVAASTAIPGVFRPALIPSLRLAPGHRFADGGLVSNLPAWAFLDEKLRWERRFPTDPPVPVVAFSLVVPPIVPGKSTRVTYVMAVARTAVFGGQRVSENRIDDLLVLKLPVELDTLAFDAGWNEVRAAYEAGYVNALHQLRRALTFRPAQMQAELERVAAEGQQHLADAGHSLSRPLRACVIVPFGPRSLRVAHAWNMESDADDRLILDRLGRGAPRAFRERNFVSLDVGAGASRAGVLATKYEQALVRPTLKAIACVPIFREASAWLKQPGQRPEPLGVLCLDSDDPIVQAFRDAGFMGWLALQGIALAPLLED
ncbi:MAG: patatin-like phospholipase family protein, partial [Acetobacteraceae bacterium]|nr:patatin-like phospholipase family protein [Acetobacteraceae bacterium]